VAPPRTQTKMIMKPDTAMNDQGQLAANDHTDLSWDA
jgi:hypothetical protein